MNYKPVLSLDHVKKIAGGCEAMANANNWNITFAIVDDGGHLMFLQRSEKAPATGAEIAPAKARLSAQGRRDSLDYQSMVDGGKVSFLAALNLPGVRGAGLEGGVAIMVDGYCIGAVGVAGASSAEDAQIARAGIAAAFPG